MVAPRQRKALRNKQRLTSARTALVMRRTWWSGALLASLVTARLPAQALCTAVVVPGLSVAVRDAATGQGITGHVTVTARDGAYIDSLRAPDLNAPRDPSLPFVGAYERAGSYVLLVRSPGYVPWRKRGVRVRKQDECHVVTVQVVARLTRVK